MSFKIQNFRSEFAKVGGGARPNLFDVTIATSGNLVPATTFKFQCKIAAIPPSTIGVIEIPYFGRMIKIPGNRTFDNLSTTIINDEKMTIRLGMERWMTLMNTHESNVTPVDFTTLQAQLTITHYGISGTNNKTGAWKFVGAFPVSLGEIGLDWGSNDTLEEFTVDWAYDYWTSDGGAQ